MSIRSFFLYLYVKCLEFTDFKITNVSRFKLTDISSTFLYQLLNASSQITRSYTYLKHTFTCFFADAKRHN